MFWLVQFVNVHVCHSRLELGSLSMLSRGSATELSPAQDSLRIFETRSSVGQAGLEIAV